MPSITLTGLDNKSLHAIWGDGSDGRIWPNLEYGVLWSNSQAGIEKRYADLDRIEAAATLISKSVRPRNKVALHVCGSAVKQLFDGQARITHAASAFDRIQLNMNFSKLGVTPDAVRLFAEKWGRPIVFQVYQGNAELFQHLQGLPNVQALIDGSGGRGISPKSWRAPLEGFATGYAGGMGPDNLATELERIAEVAKEPYWVDMEGKLRDEEDWFSLDRAYRCLEIFTAHLQAREHAERPIPG